jgi:hypothetical protein
VDPATDDDRSEVTENEVSCSDKGCVARGGGYAQDSPTAATASFNLTAVKDNVASAPKGAAFGGGLHVGGGAVDLTETVVKRNTVPCVPSRLGQR